MKKKIFYLFLGAGFVILALFYYYFYPRLALGYSNSKISMYQWKKAFPSEPNTSAHLYHNRFEKDYYYKAYQTYWYYSAAWYMGMEKEKNPSYMETIEKISCAYINENDKPIIDTLFELYRSAFIRQLEHFKPAAEVFSDIVGPCYISHYFILYYNHVTYGYDMDNNEFYKVFQWLASHDVQYKELMKDPLGMRKIDFQLCTDTTILRNWISLSIDAEFILDTDKYEFMCNNFRRFIMTILTLNNEKQLRASQNVRTLTHSTMSSG